MKPLAFIQDRLVEWLFILLALALAALVALHQVDKISRRIDAQLKARQATMEVQR